MGSPLCSIYGTLWELWGYYGALQDTMGYIMVISVQKLKWLKLKLDKGCTLWYTAFQMNAVAAKTQIPTKVPYLELCYLLDRVSTCHFFKKEIWIEVQ